jgi:hypothetical protein
MLQCSESPEHPGVWIVTNSDPLNCEGYCNHTSIPPPPLPPCEDQLYTNYWYNMMQCGENPNNPGVWVPTNTDPFNCEGFCNYTGGPTPPPPPPPVPCEDQVYSAYWYEMLQCGENPNHPGVWIQTNSDPLNCEGYCNYTGGPTPPPYVDCDIHLLKQECDRYLCGCSLKIHNFERCETECVCPNCEKIFAKEKYKCENHGQKGIACKYGVTDPSKCEGECVS